MEKYYYAGYMELCHKVYTVTMIRYIYGYISYEIEKENGNTKAFTLDTRSIRQEMKRAVEIFHNGITRYSL